MHRWENRVDMVLPISVLSPTATKTLGYSSETGDRLRPVLTLADRMRGGVELKPVQLAGSVAAVMPMPR